MLRDRLYVGNGGEWGKPAVRWKGGEDRGPRISDPEYAPGNKRVGLRERFCTANEREMGG